MQNYFKWYVASRYPVSGQLVYWDIFQENVTGSW